jgi:phospholipid/cholesterol/gamma-HCH transport system substrate-binding protein
MKRELFVGALFALLLTILLSATLWVNDPGFFRTEGTFPMTARFRDVAGLAEGAEVWVYGTPGGRVKAIRPDGRGNVEVHFVLDHDPGLRANAEVTIKARSALGGAVVAVHPGTPDAPVWKDGVFEGRAVSDVFKEISDLASEIKEPLKSTLKNAEKVSKDLSEKSTSIVDNLDSFAKNAREVSEKLNKGEGTLGKLLNDDKIHKDLEDAIASIRKLADDARTGGGALDTLINDKQLAADLKESAAKIRSVTTKLDSGEGTLGKLLNDSKPFDDLSAATADLRRITDDVRAGKGVLGKLVYDENLGRRLDTITDDVAEITGKIRRGEGTIGKLVNDDTVYSDLKAALKSLRAGSDDVRENAPVLTFAGFLFSGF